MKTLLIPAALIGLAAGPALAQGVARPGPPVNGEITSTGGIMTAPAPAGDIEATAAANAGMMAAATVEGLSIGAEVRDPQGAVVGTVQEIDPGSDSMAAMIQLGWDGKSVEVPASSINVSAEGAVTTLGRDEIWVDVR
ncbi:hypothetical protein [Phenylobacterium sp.]|jgi:hypothetical protein|uniref:hypothetical protein n=1 Tax=Phenylobacterium sp. TaxID=1871053 RepID=UPI0030010AD1